MQTSSRTLGLMVLAACASARVPNDQPPPLVSVSVLARSSEHVGRAVRVRGRCLGYGGGATSAIGGPPRTRSDWQLADSTGAIYVVGARPAECAREGGSARAIEVRGTVAEDTLRALGRITTRRYLVTP